MAKFSEMLFKLALRNESMVESNMSTASPYTVPDPGSSVPGATMPPRNIMPGRNVSKPPNARDKHDPASWLRRKEQT